MSAPPPGHGELGDYERALEDNRRTIANQEKLAAAAPNNVQIHFDIADTYSNSGEILRMMKRCAESEEIFRRVIVSYKEHLAKNPDYSKARSHFAQVYVLFAKNLLKSGNANAALENYRNALAFLETEPMRSETPDKLAESYEAIGAAHDFLAQKESSKKAQHCREAFAAYQKRLEVWQDLERRGKLSDASKNKPNEVAQKIAKCEAAPAKL